jgi:hypothetical protein
MTLAFQTIVTLFSTKMLLRNSPPASKPQTVIIRNSIETKEKSLYYSLWPWLENEVINQ